MDEITTRLIACFKTVFPALTNGQIQSATPASVAAWDSVSTLTLINVIEDEFGIQVDLDLLAEFNSFERFREYVSKEAS